MPTSVDDSHHGARGLPPAGWAPMTRRSPCPSATSSGRASCCSFPHGLPARHHRPRHGGAVILPYGGRLPPRPHSPAPCAGGQPERGDASSCTAPSRAPAQGTAPTAPSPAACSGSHPDDERLRESLDLAARGPCVRSTFEQCEAARRAAPQHGADHGDPAPAITSRRTGSSIGAGRISSPRSTASRWRSPAPSRRSSSWRPISRARGGRHRPPCRGRPANIATMQGVPTAEGRRGNSHLRAREPVRAEHWQPQRASAAVRVRSSDGCA